MKIDKKNPRHWFYLIRSGLYAFLSLTVRPFRRGKKRRVILYGHKLNGNLKAFADYYATRKNNFELYFITLDPNYYAQLNKENPSVEVLSMGKFRDMIKVAQSSVIITDHGLHTLAIYLKLTNIKFVDVWHGIGFKGEEAEGFRPMDKYAEHWVTSPAFRSMWINMFERDASKVKITGYARVDPLVKGDYDQRQLKQKYGLNYKKIITIAPTYQNVKTNSIIPFNVASSTFFSALDELVDRLKAIIIFRAHLNTQDKFNIKKFKNIKVMSHEDYPLAEEFLAITDILISDWSSIVFDFLVLHRPTIFLDIPNPRGKFSLDPKYRFGEIVKNLPELLNAIEKYGVSPKSYIKEHQKDIVAAEKMAYANTLDGKSTERYYERLQKLLV